MSAMYAGMAMGWGIGVCGCFGGCTPGNFAPPLCKGCQDNYYGAGCDVMCMSERPIFFPTDMADPFRSSAGISRSNAAGD